VNTTCPIGKEQVDSSVTSTFNGQTVGFCCANCKGKFDKMSDADKSAKLSAVTGK
jgi:YHS domain-containing protein